MFSRTSLGLAIGNIGTGNTGNIPVGRVYIIATQYFDNVAEADFNFFIGGYQPAQKWLKDRKGRSLALDEAAIEEEIRKAGAAVLVFALVPEHITGKRVHEA